MNNFISKYLAEYISSLNSIEITDGSHSFVDFENSIINLNNLFKELTTNKNKIIMVGNGGSSGICSHQTVDYLKNGNIRTINFSDSSLLTCISNDFSFSEVFSIPIKSLADRGDIVYCFSSSGNSSNILNAAKTAKEKGCFVVTFSGFEADNELRKSGNLNFYVKSSSYGHVEILHLLISHLILDYKLYVNDNIDIFKKNTKLKNENL